MSDSKSEAKHYIKIIYRDSDSKTQEVILPLGKDYYNSQISYKENIQDVVSSMYEEGGFWLNTTTIIPYHRIMSIHTHAVENKPTPKPRRRSRKKSVTAK